MASRFQEMLAERQSLAGRIEAMVEADRRAALAISREMNAIETALKTAGWLRRAGLKRQYEALQARFEQARADQAKNTAAIAGHLKTIERLDAKLHEAMKQPAHAGQRRKEIGK